MNTKLYVINALSNMHVGSGEVNYGVIDNLIQRDSTTELPIINSSGLKGAFREALKDKDYAEKVFGSSTKSARMQGKAKFFDANILSIPARSNKEPFLMVTCDKVIEEFVRKIELFECEGNEQINKLKNFIRSVGKVQKGKPVTIKPELKGAIVEERYLVVSDVIPNVDNIISTIFGENLVVVTYEEFSELCDDNHLPIMARNHLENGQSANLWYEQVLPRYSRLYFVVMDGEEIHKDLCNNVFQIGANASIGYGFCKILDVLK